MWAAAGPPSSIHHPACEVWNSCRCTRVFVCISECLRVMMLCQGLSDSSGRSLIHVVIQQTCKKHNLAPSFHLPTFPLRGKRKQNKMFIMHRGRFPISQHSCRPCCPTHRQNLGWEEIQSCFSRGVSLRLIHWCDPSQLPCSEGWKLLSGKEIWINAAN